MSTHVYILLGKVRRLLERNDGILSKVLDGVDDEWIPLRLLLLLKHASCGAKDFNASI